MSIYAKWYQHQKPVYLGDDLYSKEPLYRLILKEGAEFLFMAKPISHNELYDYLHGLPFNSKRLVHRKPGGKSETRVIQCLLGMTFRDHEQTLQVN